MSMGVWAYAIITVIVLMACALFAIVGWAVVTIIGLFTVVNISGFFAYAGIGLAACIVATLLSRD